MLCLIPTGAKCAERALCHVFLITQSAMPSGAPWCAYSSAQVSSRHQLHGYVAVERLKHGVFSPNDLLIASGEAASKVRQTRIDFWCE